mmetsp:Transcript_14132/g.30804  ORF Transcript_14132/g.30804 Transcript_14132/m.30804 type:complete len:505 (-) Transcript_14132:1434-2948(-)
MVLFSSITPLLQGLMRGQVTCWNDVLQLRAQQRPPPLFDFGTRDLVPSDVVQEVVLGLTVTLPLAFVLGRILLWVTTKLGVVRADLQHAVLSTVVGDGLLDLLLPSTKCYPTATMFPTYADWSWVRTMWGLECFVRYESDILTPHGLCWLLSIRTAFLVVGLYLGQSFCPIALTGGIATGKSTMVRLLVQGQSAMDEFVREEEDKKGSDGKTEKDDDEDDDKKDDNEHKKDDKNTTNDSPKKDNNNNNTDDVVTIYTVDCDAIGHEILLSPTALKTKQGGSRYSVSPGESVYEKVCQTFAQDNDILDAQTHEIDRAKLGAVIFADAAKRRQLNRLTHGRIAWILWKRLAYGCYLSGQDLVVAEVPLLFETQSWLLRSLFCLTVMVTVESVDVQRARLQARHPQWTVEDCRRRLDAQMPLHEKERRASYVLYNTTGQRRVVVRDLRSIQQSCMDRIHGVGISVTQIVVIVVATLMGGLLYRIHIVNKSGGGDGAEAGESAAAAEL